MTARVVEKHELRLASDNESKGELKVTLDVWDNGTADLYVGDVLLPEGAIEDISAFVKRVCDVD